MPKHLIVAAGAVLAVFALSIDTRGQNEKWNNPGLAQSPNTPQAAVKRPSCSEDVVQLRLSG